MSVSEKSKFQLKNVPPEGGFVYAVAFGMTLPIAFGLGSLSSFGLMFGEIIADNGGNTSAVTIIMGTFFSASSFAGLFTNTLFKKFSIRAVGVFGGACYFVGSFMAIFATSVEHLIVSFGVLQGFYVERNQIQGAAFGFCIPVSFTTFNQYFVIRRVFVMSVAQALIGIVMMGYPMVVNFLIEMYGYRGAIAVIAAINAHSIFGMMVMHPIEWHYRTVQVPIQEEQPLMNGSEKKSDEATKITTDDEFEKTHLPANEKNKSRISIATPTSNKNEIYMKLERSKSLDPSQYVDFEQIRQRMPSVMSLGDWNATAVMGESCERLKNGKWRKVVDFLDLALLKDVVYLNIVFGIACALYSDNAFFTLQPLYLFELKFSQKETAMIVAAGAAADLGSRVFLAVFSYFIQVKARNIYLFGAVATVLFRCVFLTLQDFVGIAVITAVMGFFRPMVHVPIAIIFGEILPQERFASGYGLFMFLQGNFAFLIGPFVGWIRDVTHSFVICFHSLSIIMALCAIPWIIEIVWLRIHPKKEVQKVEP